MQSFIFRVFLQITVIQGLLGEISATIEDLGDWLLIKIKSQTGFNQNKKYRLVLEYPSIINFPSPSWINQFGEVQISNFNDCKKIFEERISLDPNLGDNVSILNQKLIHCLGWLSKQYKIREFLGNAIRRSWIISDNQLIDDTVQYIKELSNFGLNSSALDYPVHQKIENLGDTISIMLPWEALPLKPIQRLDDTVEEYDKLLLSLYDVNYTQTNSSEDLLVGKVEFEFQNPKKFFLTSCNLKPEQDLFFASAPEKMSEQITSLSEDFQLFLKPKTKNLAEFIIIKKLLKGYAYLPEDVISTLEVRKNLQWEVNFKGYKICGPRLSLATGNSVIRSSYIAENPKFIGAGETLFVIDGPQSQMFSGFGAGQDGASEFERNITAHFVDTESGKIKRFFSISLSGTDQERYSFQGYTLEKNRLGNAIGKIFARPLNPSDQVDEIDFQVIYEFYALNPQNKLFRKCKTKWMQIKGLDLDGDASWKFLKAELDRDLLYAEKRAKNVCSRPRKILRVPPKKEIARSSYPKL